MFKKKTLLFQTTQFKFYFALWKLVHIYTIIDVNTLIFKTQKLNLSSQPIDVLKYIKPS